MRLHIAPGPSEPIGEQKTLRRVCLTLNNYTEEDVTKLKHFIEAHARYGIFGREIGEKEHTPHLQGYM